MSIPEKLHSMKRPVDGIEVACGSPYACKSDGYNEALIDIERLLSKVVFPTYCRGFEWDPEKQFTVACCDKCKHNSPKLCGIIRWKEETFTDLYMRQGFFSHVLLIPKEGTGLESGVKKTDSQGDIITSEASSKSRQSSEDKSLQSSDTAEASSILDNGNWKGGPSNRPKSDWCGN